MLAQSPPRELFVGVSNPFLLFEFVYMSRLSVGGALRGRGFGIELWSDIPGGSEDYRKCVVLCLHSSRGGSRLKVSLISVR